MSMWFLFKTYNKSIINYSKFSVNNNYLDNSFNTLETIFTASSKSGHFFSLFRRVSNKLGSSINNLFNNLSRVLGFSATNP